MADLVSKAEAAAARKDWAQAADLLTNAGDSNETWEKRAFYLSRAARYDEAIELLGQLRKREPQSARVPYAIGFQHAQREEWQRAIEWYRRALEIAPDYLKASYRLAQAHHRAGNKAPAQVAAAKVVRLWHAGDEDFKNRERAKFARACHLLAKLQLHNDPDGAVELLRQAVEQEPRDVYHRYLLGKALTRSGRPHDALEPLRQAKQMEPRKMFIELELIRALAETGCEQEASERLRRVARRCHAWDAYNGGRVALCLGDVELARSLLERAARRGPTREDTRVKELLGSLPESPPASSDDKSSTRQQEQPTGEVVYLNPKRHFGFLVDEAGVKRHFRLRDKNLHKGAEVTFAPAEQKKGPAADDVRIAS